MAPKSCVLASRNKHKIEELRQLLVDLDIELKSSLDFSGLQEVEEDGETLQENAFKKVFYTYSEIGLPSVADDTGLEVDALQGEPGVYSARYAGENATYQDNVNKLLLELENCKQDPPFSARFKTVIAYKDDETEWWGEGVCEGNIILKQRGENGFGYDPVFVPEGYEKTFAELDADTKNKISHRGRAMDKFISWMKSRK
jgi:XTP/dITP diphosphohydrolase